MQTRETRRISLPSLPARWPHNRPWSHSLPRSGAGSDSRHLPGSHEAEAPSALLTLLGRTLGFQVPGAGRWILYLNVGLCDWSSGWRQGAVKEATAGLLRRKEVLRLLLFLLSNKCIFSEVAAKWGGNSDSQQPSC